MSSARRYTIDAHQNTAMCGTRSRAPCICADNISSFNLVSQSTKILSQQIPSINTKNKAVHPSARKTTGALLLLYSSRNPRPQIVAIRLSNPPGFGFISLEGAALSLLLYILSKREQRSNSLSYWLRSSYKPTSEMDTLPSEFLSCTR